MLYKSQCLFDTLDLSTYKIETLTTYKQNYCTSTLEIDLYTGQVVLPSCKQSTQQFLQTTPPFLSKHKSHRFPLSPFFLVVFTIYPSSLYWFPGEQKILLLCFIGQKFLGIILLPTKMCLQYILQHFPFDQISFCPFAPCYLTFLTFRQNLFWW